MCTPIGVGSLLIAYKIKQKNMKLQIFIELLVVKLRGLIQKEHNPKRCAPKITLQLLRYLPNYRHRTMPQIVLR